MHQLMEMARMFDVFDAWWNHVIWCDHVTWKKSRSKRRPILARPKSVSLKWLKGLCSQHHIANLEKTRQKPRLTCPSTSRSTFSGLKVTRKCSTWSNFGPKVFIKKYQKIMEHVLAERKPFQPCSMKWMKWRCDCCDCYSHILLSLELQISVANPFVMQIF